MKYTVLALLLSFLCACDTEPAPKAIPDWDTKRSTELNKEFAIREDIDIKLYLAHHEHEGWKVEQTGSGLRIITLHEGKGDFPKPGQDVRAALNVVLLDGRAVYKTPEDEVEVIRIDESEIESGIQEGIKRMKPGGKTRLIIPSHLAHGLMGDMDKVPPLSTLVVDIELPEIK